jgi:hypothetical protein
VAELGSLGDIERRMKSKALRIALGIIGVALLVWGAIHVIADVRENFHPFGSGTSGGFSLMIRLHWFAVGIAGALLCAWSLLVKSKKQA